MDGSSGLQAGQFSNRTLLPWSHGVVIGGDCFAEKIHTFSEKDVWMAAHVASKPVYLYYRSALAVLSQRLPMLCALIHPNSLTDAAF